MTRRVTATPYLFLAPALVLIAIFVVYPIGAVLYYSFTDYNIINPPVWVGLDNYRKLVADPVFWKALTHSIVYLIVTPTIIALSVSLAIVVNRKLRGIHIYRALYYVPAVSGSIAIGIAWRWLFDRNGFINSALVSLGVIRQPIQWLSDPNLVLPIAMLLTIWAGIGYYAVIFLAGLQNIPEELYDAAEIDGCNRLRVFGQIFLPNAGPVLAASAIFAFQWVWGDFFLQSIFLNESHATLAMKLASSYVDPRGNPLYTQTLAAVVIYVLPLIVVFFLAQKNIVRGVVTTGLK
jgi:putative chitobiose transport system permease protein